MRAQVFITERIVDQIAEGVDLAFRVRWQLEDSSLVARKILTYRHRRVASPSYLAGRKLPAKPQDLLQHRLLAFSFWKPVSVWTFVKAKKKNSEVSPSPRDERLRGPCVRVARRHRHRRPSALVQPELLREGKLVEVMPNWHFRIFHLWLVHLGNRCLARPVRVFKEFATQMAPTLFPTLPT